MSTLKYLFYIVLLTVQPISAQGFWQQTNGPYGGATVNDFLLYGDSIIYIGTNEGLIKSTDYGNSWTRINSFKVTCLGIDKLNNLYFGISGHLKRSTDGGDNWTDVTVLGAAVKDFVISYKDTIFIGSWDTGFFGSNGESISNGVFRSFDYGNSWSLVNNGIQYPGIYKIILLSNSSLLVGTSGGGVYKSTNWGDSWVSSNNGIPANSQGYRYAESFFEFAPGQILTGTHNSIYYSSNYGDSWIYRGIGYNNNYATCFEMDESGILYAGSNYNDGVYCSTNNGNNWNYIGLTFSIYTLGWDSDFNLYAGGSRNGLKRYIDEDSTWTQVYNQGYTQVETNLLSLTQNGNLLASAPGWGLYFTTDSGQLWTKTNYSGYEPFDIVTINDSIFIAGDISYAYVSNDYGTTWDTKGYFNVQTFYSDQTEQTIYLGTDKSTNNVCGIYKSSDFGQSWEILYSLPILSPFQRIAALYASENSGIILASVIYGSGPPIWSGENYFYYSTDYGQTWETIYYSQFNSVTRIIKSNFSNIYALARTNLLISQDGGNTWITRTIPESESLASDYSGRLFRSYGGGLSYSINQGISWLGINQSGLQGVYEIHEIAIYQDNRIYIATNTGVYLANTDSIVLSTEVIQPTKSFYLFQNYPNPFNPTTKIKYTIPSVETTRRVVFTTLKVYDVLGNEIATLVNEEKQPGTYEIEFNIHSDKGRNLSSGIYFYQLQSGNYIETKKMVLLK